MKSFLDQDLYTFTVQQAVWEHYPDAHVRYRFIDRNKTKIVDPYFLNTFKDKLDEISNIKPTKQDIAYLKSLGYFKPAYLTRLENIKFNSDAVHAYIQDGQLQVNIEGPWAHTILWEVPLLAMITELYLEDTPTNINAHCEKLKGFAKTLKDLNFCEFGTRRRRNYAYQYHACDILSQSPGFKGTSNVHLAHEFDLKPIGTMSHQWIMGNSAFAGVRTANAEALWRWAETYDGKLGVALTDTFGTDVFLKNFGGLLSRMYDGVRQDSGNPVAFAKLIDKHYKQHQIKSEGKTVYFSDGLSPSDCLEIDKEISNMNLNFARFYCMGTSFTNDQRLNIVIKLDEVDGHNVVKFSDDPGKETGNPSAIEYAKQLLAKE